jgi:hypothetical protein
MTTRIFVRAAMPDDQRERWVQHLLAFDRENPGCRFEVFVEGPEEPMADIIKRLTVEPGLTFTDVFRRPKQQD